jgi:hypothetical protein
MKTNVMLLLNGLDFDFAIPETRKFFMGNFRHSTHEDDATPRGNDQRS